ncbi:MAG: hypothetical protein ABJO67_10250 [Pseudoruegeria sp.]
MQGPDGPRQKAFNIRWTASMVADVHRILIRGGVFLYPLDAANHPASSRLRLLYETIPMAMIIEAAGGRYNGQPGGHASRSRREGICKRHCPVLSHQGGNRAIS